MLTLSDIHKSFSDVRVPSEENLHLDTIDKFSIKRITETTHRDFLAALKIYNEATPNYLKTNTNEIIYWLTKEKEFPFESFFFCLYLNNTVIGFAMLSYIKQQRIIVIEYLEIEQKYKVYAVFSAYINLLQSYIKEINLDIAFYVSEIDNKSDSKNRDIVLFKNLIGLEGFGKIEALYITPPIGIKNDESSFEAFLYIKANDRIQNISKKTYLDIVHAIYYDYFFVWYEGIMNTQEELNIYKQKIDDCFVRIKKSTPTALCNILYDCSLLRNNPSDLQTFSVPVAKKVEK